MSDVDVISKLTKNHLDNLKRIVDDLKTASRLKEHFQVVHNSLESNETTTSTTKRTIRLNENLLAENEKKSKRFEIKWNNLDHCERCMLSYWPSNCRVYIAPKFGLSRTSSQLFTRYKLIRNSKPFKYKSFKDKLIRSIMSRSMRLIYKCRRCKSRNSIVRELNHAEPKLIRINNRRNKNDKERNKQNLKIMMNRIVAAPSVNMNKNNNRSNNFQVSHQVQTESSVKVRDKKFKSLQAKLKHSESQQETAKNEKKNSFGSLADFLEKMN